LAYTGHYDKNALMIKICEAIPKTPKYINILFQLKAATPFVKLGLDGTSYQNMCAYLYGERFYPGWKLFFRLRWRRCWIYLLGSAARL
jgi:hypothetical protein